MESLYVNEIIKATKGKLVKGDQSFQIKGISIDSRSIKKGDLFIAIKGDNFDGHKFIGNAIKNGASGIVLSSLFSDTQNSVSVIIKVGDTLKALQDLAKYYRGKFNIPIVIITCDARGSYLYSSDKVIYQPALPAKLADATGAGDAFSAGFLGKYVKTGDLKKSMEFAARNAKAEIEALGAQTGLLNDK